MTWFQQGYQKVEERQREIDEAMKGSLPNLIIKEEDENVYVSFVTADPITFYEHFLPNLKRSFTCPDNGDSSKGTCPLCSMGNKPTFRGAYLVIDHRYEEWERDGKKNQRQHTLKVAKFGIRVLKSLQKLDAKLKKGTPVTQPIPEGVIGVPFEVIRSGKGTDTQYAFNALQPSAEHFPRKYELEQGKTEVTTIVDNIKPLANDQLLAKINGGTTSNQQSYGQPAHFGQPAQYDQYGHTDQYGQNPQFDTPPPPTQLGGGYPDEDVIDFNS